MMFIIVGSDGKSSVYNAGDPSSILRLGRSPWRRKWQPTPVFLPGKSDGQKNLMGYCPWVCKESDMTWQLNNNKKCIDKLWGNKLM